MIERKRIEEAVVLEVEKLLAEETGKHRDVALQDGLTDSGLDSLAFAVLVTRLEESLGFDPFLALEEEIYPRTVAELADIYFDHQVESPA